MQETDPIRRELHALLDHVPPSDLTKARSFPRSLVDPVSLSLLSAPENDEPETHEERAAVESARRETGPGTPHEEVLREFGVRRIGVQLRVDVRSGFEAVDRGECSDYTASSIETLASQVKATGRRQLAAKRESQSR